MFTQLMSCWFLGSQTSHPQERMGWGGQTLAQLYWLFLLYPSHWNHGFIVLGAPEVRSQNGPFPSNTSTPRGVWSIPATSLGPHSPFLLPFFSQGTVPPLSLSLYNSASCFMLDLDAGLLTAWGQGLCLNFIPQWCTAHSSSSISVY